MLCEAFRPRILTSMKSRIAVFWMSAMWALLLGPGVARASGIRIKKHLTLAQTVKGSKLIVAGKVVKIDHVYNRRRAYGRMVTYMSVFRVRIKVEKVIRGPRKLKGRTALLTRTIYGIPGRWALVDRAYASSLALGSVKNGTRIIAFVLKDKQPAIKILSRKSGKLPWIKAFAIEHARLLKKVTKLAGR